ncbi:hypothetical protein [Massilia varians]|uniref:hypothetical protein n=1 Tax=Massilia varians TaxID=457921 RepID=UPI002554F915|nr:hypothetical protein [Massilia varians]MDK6078943.1 hypothetical protein [Massilia varians]
MRKILAVLFFAYLAISIFAPKKDEDRPAASVTAPVVKTAEQEAAERAQQKRRNMATLTAAAIKRSLHDPDSLKWASILANEDASVICFEYRAKNGFGAMRLQQATYVNEKLTESVSAWNRHCARKTLFDMTPSRS